MTTRSTLRLGLGRVLGAVLVLLVLAPSPARAHDPGATLLGVAVGDPGAPTGEVTLHALVPLHRYDAAHGTSLAGEPGAAERVEARSAALAEHVLTSMTIISGPSGEADPWDEEVVSLGHRAVDGVGYLDVTVVATSTQPGDTGEAIDLTWTLVPEGLLTRRVLVVSEDRAEEALAAETVAGEDLLGVITRQQPTLRIDVAPGGLEAFTGLLVVGFEHFREGPDHLLFLCLLALSAVRRRDGLGATARRLAVLTVTFTLGHSISLGAATLGLATLPGVWVETAIAASIVLAAWHAVRPRLALWPEVAVTAAFGLVHGLGFAGTLADLSLSGTAAVVPLLGFNTGLELAQLLGLAVVVAPLALIARSAPASLGVAVAVGAVAVSWIGERALGLPDPSAPVVALLAGTPERLALTLAAVAALAWLTRRRASSPVPSTSTTTAHQMENR